MTPRPGTPAPAPGPEDRRILTPSAVARLFGVDRKTVTRWASAGKLSSFRTPGGQRRFYASEVERHIRATGRKRWPRAPAPRQASSQPASAGDPSLRRAPPHPGGSQEGHQS